MTQRLQPSLSLRIAFVYCSQASSCTAGLHADQTLPVWWEGSRFLNLELQGLAHETGGRV